MSEDFHIQRRNGPPQEYRSVVSQKISYNLPSQ
jgi:hypothetical protein